MSAFFKQWLRSFTFSILVIAAGSSLSAQQVVLEDDFEDEDLTSNPEWTGDLANFTTVDESGNKLLRLSAPDGGSSVLTTPSTTTQGVWDLFYRFEFAPSGSNRTRIFLMADTDDLEGSVNGYAISIGESGGDPFRLVRYDNGSETEILASTTEVSAGQGYQIRVTRDDTGAWELLIGTGYGSAPVSEAGPVTDATHQSSSHFGFLLDYTSTRTESFFFDDIQVQNSEPFEVVGATVESGLTVDVTFNYPMDSASLDTGDFSVDGGVGTPDAVSLENDFTVRLTFSSVLPDGNYTLTVNDVDNAFGGTIPANSEASFSVDNPFEVVSVDAVSGSRIAVEFTEAPDISTFQPGDFEITEDGMTGGGVNPASIDYDGSGEPSTIYLLLASSLPIGDYDLSIGDIESENAWPLSGGSEFDFSVVNPFIVTSFDIIDKSTFDITFAEDVDASSLNNSDFVITGFGSPASAGLEEPDRVRISYASDIDVGERELVLNDFESVNDWEIEQNTTINFTLFDEFAPGDLVISEFYYRTPTEWRTPQFNRPQYIEILNRADKLLNLRNFTINGENISIDTDLPISSGEYLVITRGVPVFEDQFGSRNFVEADEFPELNLTTSDDIIFETDTGTEIESLTYDASEWGGNEVSLERFAFDVDAGIRDNWAESEDILTGSPGLPNTVDEPANPPEAVAASFPSPAVLHITFSRTLASDALSNLSNFSLNNGAVINSAAFTSEPRTIEFQLNDLLEDGFEYTFSYSNVEDIFGNEVSGTDQFLFTFENPFRILSAEVENGNELLVRFTLPLQVSTVQLGDFELGDGTDPQSFTFDNSETVRLIFGSAFGTGAQEIVVNDIESLTQGWQLEQNSSRVFYRFDEYQDGDIVINEFMYNPPSGYPQYVELYNRSGRFLSLKDFELLRAEGSSSIGGVISEFDEPIGPGDYIVITPDAEELESVFGNGPWFQMDNFPGITQTIADQIRLVDPDGALVEAVSYDPATWGGDEVALERKSVSAPSDDINNWGESLDPDLGTPGEENSVSPDDPPALLSASFVDAETVQVSFSGSLDISAIDEDNFDLNRGRSVTAVTFLSPTLAELTLDGEMQSGRTYTVTVQDIPDIFGNELDQAEASFTYYFVEIAEEGDVVINEFMYDQPEGYTEYVELFNRSDKVFDLSGWQQANDTGTRRVLTEEQVFLTPGSYVVLLPSPDLLQIFPDIDFIDAGSSFPSLKNTADEIVIVNAEGTTIDSLRYSSEWGGEDVALERLDADALSSDQNNWEDSQSVLNGTPGSPNSVELDTDGPQLLSADFIDERSVRMLFDGALNRGAISRNNFDIDGGRSVSEVTFLSSREAILFLDDDMASGRTYTVTVQNIPDIFGNELEEAEAEFTYFDIVTAEPGDVVINEIMYDEPEGYTSYIELYNASNKAFDLSGWQQANDTANRNVLTEERTILPPGSYIAILPNFNLLTIFPDIPHLNAGSSLSALKNGGDNVVVANAEGTIIDSLRYSPDWGGDGVALERRRADRSSLFADNWGDSPAELLGTPGMPNAIDDDFLFTVSDVQALSPTQVKVTFNAAVRKSDLAPSSFSVDDTNPETVAEEDARTVLLQFSQPFGSGQRELLISGVRSAGGFRIDGNPVFSFIVFDLFSRGDVVINEFMYRPPSGYVRYVELVNTSSKLLNLRGWRLQRRNVSGDSPRVIADRDTPLEPGEYIVLAEDSDALADIFGERNYLELPDFPSYTVTVADQIRLFSSDGSLADSLQYVPDSWGGDGVALERRSTSVESFYRENWAESPAGLLGTPGQPNQVAPDREAPVLTRSAQFEDQGFILEFDERLDPESSADPSKYSITPSLPVSMVGLDNNRVILFAGGELQSGTEYTVSAEGVTDIFGNEIDPLETAILYLEFGDAEPGQVVINEIMYDPSSSGAEFVELFNRTGENFDLSGWSLSDQADDVELPPGTAIRQDDYLVLTGSQGFASQSDRFIYIPDFPSLNDTEDELVLRSPAETVIDSLLYRSGWGEDEEGRSLERLDPSGLSFDPSNWSTSSADRGSTPGEENSRFAPDETSPTILFANLFHPDSIEVVFDEFVNLSPSQEKSEMSAFEPMKRKAEAEETVTARFLINGSEADVIQYSLSAGDRVVLDATPVSLGEEITVEAQGVGDFKGNMAGELQQPVSQPVASGDLVINEILFDPISDDRDGLPDQSEYIEIYNRRSYAVSLEGIVLHDEPDEDGDVSIIDPVDSRRKWLPAGGQAVIYPEPENISFNESRLAEFFGIDTDPTSFTLRTDRTSLSLPNDGRQVYLADSTLRMIDMVEYSEEWHNPNLIDTKGIALERINPDFESNNASNWGSNSTPLGGSPLARNSIFQGGDGSITGVGVELTPNPFSPDGDGFEDNLLISYALDEPDYLLKIRIYDRYGRLVRKLAEARPAGFEGSLIWDGFNDEGLRNRIGIYVILIEAFNSSNGQNRTFKETAVIARQF